MQISGPGSSSSSSSSSSPSPSYFTQLPTELQITIWQFALPRRTIHINVDDVLKGRSPTAGGFSLPPHGPPAVSRVCRTARWVALRTGRYLCVLKASSSSLQAPLFFAPSPPPVRAGNGDDEKSISSNNKKTEKRSRSIIWFDPACDTLLMSDLLLWPQDIEANPVAIGARIWETEGIDPATMATDVHFDVNSQLMPPGAPLCPLHVPGLRLRLLTSAVLFGARRPGAAHEAEGAEDREPQTQTQTQTRSQSQSQSPSDEDGSVPASGQGPEPRRDGRRQQDQQPAAAKVIDLRLWPGRVEMVYTDRDLTISIRRPLPAAVHAEFFPEGSTAAFVDLSDISPPPPPPPSPPPSSSSISSSSRNTAHLAATTTQKLRRLLRAYRRTQDLTTVPSCCYRDLGAPDIDADADADTAPAVRLLGCLVADDDDDDPAARALALLARKREDLAAKWLRVRWMALPRAEREGGAVRGAALCKCSLCSSSAAAVAAANADANANVNANSDAFHPPSPPPPSESQQSSPSTPFSGWWSPSSSSTTPSAGWWSPSPAITVPAAFRPSVVPRMPRPYAAAFACPGSFVTDHPWARGALEAMPRLRLGLLIRLEGEAAAAAAATTTATTAPTPVPAPGRERAGDAVDIAPEVVKSGEVS